jgi:DNA-binding winged helix-turn-helix (wHTH) protein
MSARLTVRWEVIALHGTKGRLLTGADLAAVPDFEAGPLAVTPGRRLIEGPGGSQATEPLVMQLLVALAEADGRVVTRDDLVHRCWGGMYVAEESVNRAVSELRRALRRAGAYDAVETVPRAGYRLALPVVWRIAAQEAGAGFVAALEAGRQALRAELPDQAGAAVASLRAATDLRPADAGAFGLLACALRNAAEHARPDTVSALASDAEAAARRALALDPAEGHALAALATLQPDFGDWIAAEDRLNGVLALAPGALPALSHLEMLLQSVGRTEASLDVNLRGAALDPLSPIFQFRRALKHWIMGDPAAADRAIDRTLQLWPQHPAVWNARMMLFAYTGRASAARGLLSDEPSLPAGLPAAAVALWHLCLDALDSRSASDIAIARRTLLAAAPRAYPTAVTALMTLSTLGELDCAFTIADAVLRRRGPTIGRLFAADGHMSIPDVGWRRTMPLFTPATAAMRADPRFLPLCEDIGLGDYWRQRRIGPDARQGVRWPPG